MAPVDRLEPVGFRFRFQATYTIGMKTGQAEARPTGVFMDLSQLHVFLTVAKEHSFSRAAEKLYRTQPAVSIVIRKLEESVGQLAAGARRAPGEAHPGCGRTAARLCRAPAESAR